MQATTLVGLCGSAWVKEGARFQAAAAAAAAVSAGPPGATSGGNTGVAGATAEAAGSNASQCAAGVVSEQCRLTSGASSEQQGHIWFVSIGLAGHTVPLIRLGEEMMRRGYTASIITHDNLRHMVEAVPGLRFVSAGPLPLPPDELRQRLGRISEGTSGIRSLISLLSDVYLPLALPLYDLALDLRLTMTTRPDLIVLDVGAAGAKDLAEGLGVPLVLNSPTLLFRLDNRPNYMPSWGTGFSMNMSILERCVNLIFPRLLSVGLTPALLSINRVRSVPPCRTCADTQRPCSRLGL